MIHDFNDLMRVSKEHENDAILERAYRQLWPDMDSYELNSDRETQKQGIDKWIIMEDGHRFSAEEKMILEYPPPTVFLETRQRPGIPGYMSHRLKCDVITYYFPFHESVFILDYNTFWDAWCKMKDVWMQDKKSSDRYEGCVVSIGQLVGAGARLEVDLDERKLSKAQMYYRSYRSAR